MAICPLPVDVAFPFYTISYFLAFLSFFASHFALFLSAKCKFWCHWEILLLSSSSCFGCESCTCSSSWSIGHWRGRGRGHCPTWSSEARWSFLHFFHAPCALSPLQFHAWLECELPNFFPLYFLLFFAFHQLTCSTVLFSIFSQRFSFPHYIFSHFFFRLSSFGASCALRKYLFGQFFIGLLGAQRRKWKYLFIWPRLFGLLPP